MPGAVLPFERLRDRLRPSDADGRRQRRAGEGAEGDPALESKPGPTERLFPHRHWELWNKVLDELGMKKDREGNARTAYSLRHTYISMRLMEGADIYQVAKNCRTSVEMIEKFYATHIKHMIDASAVNIRRPRSGERIPKGDAKTARSKFGREIKAAAKD